jgi:hypothetical protein
MHLFDRDKVIGAHLSDFFLPPGEYVSAVNAFRQVIISGRPEWFSYAVGDLAFLVLIDLLDNGMVAVHEVLDDIDDRMTRKMFLWAASGNFHRDLFREETG